jgi:hypothetical protein
LGNPSGVSGIYTHQNPPVETGGYSQLFLTGKKGNKIDKNSKHNTVGVPCA